MLQEEVALKIAEDTNRSLYLLTIITTYFCRRASSPAYSG